MTGSGFHTPGNSKICLFFCLIYESDKKMFLPDIVYAKHHIYTQKALNKVIVYNHLATSKNSGSGF